MTFCIRVRNAKTLDEWRRRWWMYDRVLSNHFILNALYISYISLFWKLIIYFASIYVEGRRWIADVGSSQDQIETRRVFKWKLVEVHAIVTLVRVMHGWCKRMVSLRLIPPGGLTRYIHTSRDISPFPTMHDNTKFSHSSYETFSSSLDQAFPIMSLACEFQLLDRCGRMGCMMALKRSYETNKTQLNIIEFVLA